jgi:purine-binding chemotaxis protein CheW
VDRVGGVVRLPVGALKPPPGILHGVAAEYLLGVALHEGRLMILLNVERALESEQRAISDEQ